MNLFISYFAVKSTDIFILFQKKDRKSVNAHGGEQVLSVRKRKREEKRL
jgi:hypothetical protein